MSVLHLDDSNFDDFIENADKKVLVDFWATWCGPCKQVGPILDELAEETKDAIIVKVDVDKSPNLAKKFRVMAVPTFVLFEKGEVLKTESGFKQKEQLIELIS